MDQKEYRFGDYVLDGQSLQLSKNGQAVALNNRGARLLLILVQASPKPVSKKSLHELLWPNSIVSNWSLSRLVSDTRIALGDDGENQSTIKTAHGEGFLIPEVEIIYQQHKEEKKPWWLRLPFISACCLIVITLITFVFVYHQQNNSLYQAIERIAHYQDISYPAFIAQAKRRNQLVDMLEKRLSIKRDQQFELFFQQYYQKMNEQEKFVCSQIRAYSDAGLYNSNKAIYDQIIATPEVANEIPLANTLRQHLRLWLDKYEQVFKKRKDMCLVYIGVEDGVPYPSGVDGQVKEWLEKAERAADN